MKSQSVTIQIKATEQYCGAVYYVVQGGSNFWICAGMRSWRVTIHMKATEQYFPVVLFILLYKVVLTFESVPGWNPEVWPFK